MEMLLVTFLSMILFLLCFLLWRTQSSQKPNDTMEKVLNEKFISFSQDIRETMDSTRKEVEQSKDILSKNAIETLKYINNMSKTVGDLVHQQEKAQELGQSLEYLLQMPKLRGNYGEMILEELLERALPQGIWHRQYVIDGGEKVDAVVKYRDVIVPIDSKFPKDHYQRYLSATDPVQKKRFWAEYEKALKVQINSIRDKYVKPEKGTTEFALLFIPSESIYYETIAEKNFIGDPCQINEYATKNKVIPVSPNTFFAFLNVVMLGIRNIEIVREAKKLQESLVKVERDFTFFYKMFENIGRNLENATESYRKGDTHIKRFKKDLETTINLENNIKNEGETEMVSTEPE